MSLSDDAVPKRVEGVWAAVATPLRETREIDVASLVRLCQHLTRSRLDGLLLFGSTGEGLALSLRDKIQAITEVRRAVGSSVPVAAGILAPTTRSAIEEAIGYASVGIDRLVVTPPHFFPPEDRRSLVQHFDVIARATNVPIVIYNVPTRTNVTLSIDDIAELAEIKNIIGIKDSSGNASHVAELIYRLGGNRIFSICDGSEENWIASGIAGSDGAMLGIANVCPVWCAQAWRLMREGQHARAQAVNRQILALTKKVFCKGSIFGGLKAALNHLGFSGLTISLPMQPLSAQMRLQLADELDEISLNEPIPFSDNGHRLPLERVASGGTV